MRLGEQALNPDHPSERVSYSALVAMRAKKVSKRQRIIVAALR
jgi:hypothetical protein